MPKNPVRAARQASRQAIRTAKTANRQDARALKTTAKVEKIANKTASKIAKIKAAAPKRAAEAPMEKIEAKGATKISSPKSSGPVKSTPRSMTEVAKGMKPKKSGSKSGSRSGSGGGGGRPAPPRTTPVSETIKKSAEKMGWDLNKKSTPKGKGIYDGMSKDAMDYSARDIIRGGKNTVKETGRQIKMYGEAKGRQANDSYEGAKQAVKRGLDMINPFSTKKKGGSVKKYQTGGKVDPYTTKPTATSSMYKRSGVTLKKNADGTYTKAKVGGMVKRKK